MPVAIGYICLVVAKRSQERAMALLEGSGARSIVTYLMVLLLGFMSLTSSGCARYNMREQDVVKSTEARSEYPPANSVRMMPEADAKYAAPPAMAAVHFGDTDTYTKMRALEQQKMRLGRDKDALTKAGKTAEAEAADKKRTEVVAQVTAMQAQMKTLGTEPSLSALKSIGAPPPSMKDWKNPYAGDKASVARGEQLYLTNCAACHGKTGLGDGKVGEVTYVEPPKIGSGKTYGKLDDGYLYYYIYTGKNLMPSFGYRLPNQEICDIVNHLRELQKVNP
jgi:mono/diheme cytochrome c family protein